MAVGAAGAGAETWIERPLDGWVLEYGAQGLLLAGCLLATLLAAAMLVEVVVWARRTVVDTWEGAISSYQRMQAADAARAAEAARAADKAAAEEEAALLPSLTQRSDDASNGCLQGGRPSSPMKPDVVVSLGGFCHGISGAHRIDATPADATSPGAEPSDAMTPGAMTPGASPALSSGASNAAAASAGGAARNTLLSLRATTRATARGLRSLRGNLAKATMLGTPLSPAKLPPTPR